jgi:hypothetical protein
MQRILWTYISKMHVIFSNWLEKEVTFYFWKQNMFICLILQLKTINRLMIFTWIYSHNSIGLAIVLYCQFFAGSTEGSVHQLSLLWFQLITWPRVEDLMDRQLENAFYLPQLARKEVTDIFWRQNPYIKFCIGYLFKWEQHSVKFIYSMITCSAHDTFFIFNGKG